MAVVFFKTKLIPALLKQLFYSIKKIQGFAGAGWICNYTNL